MIDLLITQIPYIKSFIHIRLFSVVKTQPNIAILYCPKYCHIIRIQTLPRAVSIIHHN